MSSKFDGAGDEGFSFNMDPPKLRVPTRMGTRYKTVQVVWLMKVVIRRNCSD